MKDMIGNCRHMVWNGLLGIVLSVLVSAATVQGANGILREVYENIEGSTLQDLTNNAAFPSNPTSENIITDYFEAPTDVLENYGQRLTAQIIAPTTGNYIFWIASDDASGLWLSTDETPANKRWIAGVSGWTPSRSWYVESGQQSQSITLRAGQKYYIEALMKEGTGGDNLAVRWQLPDGTMEEPIPVSRLLVYGLGAPQFSQQPADVTVAEGGIAQFSAALVRATGATYQWQRNGTNLPDATGSSLSFGPVTLGDNGSLFRCVASNSYGSTNSTQATLTVRPDTTAPALASVYNLGGAEGVTVLFSEPVESATATDPNNYTLDNQAVVKAARFAGDAQTVYLTTTVLQYGTTYTLTVNNVKDCATTPNTIAANSSRTFRLTLTPLDTSVLRGTSEPLGPSNRRGGLVISEIMYHPAERTDGKRLEYVEIFNTHDWPEDISQWRLDGAVEYRFPTGTILPKRSFLVVAASPEDLKAVYGVTNVVGGFTNNMANDHGTVRLCSAFGAIMVEAEYDSVPPYSVAADGGGHSLVLARPSYGEGQPEAWAASEMIGGSPGTSEPSPTHPYKSIFINELVTHTDEPQVDYVELYNYSSQAVDLSGCVLTDDPATNKYVLPEGTVIPPLGFVVMDQNTLGFALNSGGEKVFLFNPAHTEVVDAVNVGPMENGVSYGRYPDGAKDFSELTTQTPGGNNSVPLVRNVVINEIMYKPISGDDNDEYVELYNKGGAAVDLSRWRFTSGIDYQFPANTVLPAGGYLVVAKNTARMMSNYPNLHEGNLVGNFKGSLANSGERLALAMPHMDIITNANQTLSTNVMYIVADEVTYKKGGRWPRWADGGGSSLELVDPNSDNRRADNWADSDESAKSQWTTVEWTGMLDNGNSGYSPNQLQMFLLGAGECLVDDVETFKTGGKNLVSNPTFDSLTGWTLQGNHSQSYVQSSGGVSDGSCLHVTAQGRGDTGANRIRTALGQGLSSGVTGTLRAKVRWLKGWPEFLLRLRGNWLEATCRLNVPANLGTPGMRNSRARSNAGPAIYDVAHQPVLPAGNQVVTVRARVDDPNGLASLVLNYRVDPDTNIISTGMTYNGAGYYSAKIPAQKNGTLVAFHIQATDGSANATRTLFPNNAPERECLIRYGEPSQGGTFGTYRLWLSKKNLDAWSQREKLSNAAIDSTFVYGSQRAIYNVGALYAGSPFLSPGYDTPVGSLCGYVFEFPEDDLCLNATDFTLDWPIRDGTAQLEHIAYWMAEKLGLPNSYRRFVHLYVNGNHRGTIYEDCLQPNSDTVDQWFPDDAEGNLYKIDDWFEFDDAASGFSNIDATLQNFTTTGGQKKTARYRWNWRKRAVKESANDYSTLFALVDALNNSNANTYTAGVQALVDVPQWMRTFALEHIVINWDSFGFNRGKNMSTYKPNMGKWTMFMWDVDFLFMMGGSTDTDLFTAGDPTIATMLNHPPFRRMYYQALQDYALGPMTSTDIRPQMDARYAALLANGISVSSPDEAKTWIEQRRTYVLQQVNLVNAAFAITSGSGQNFSTNRSTITLTGTAPVAVRRLTINGMEYPLTWKTMTSWSATIALQPGQNRIVAQGYDRNGLPVASTPLSITINYTGTADQPEDKLVINEIMYHPAVSGASFVELFNNSTTTSFDLSQWRLNGVDFIFPDGTLITPQAYLVVAEDRLVFATNYGASIPLVGQYNGQLDHGGETISLIKPGGTNSDDVVISTVTYNDKAPWPVEADGFGPSLQLIDPNQDIRRVGNWAASATNATVKATPGTANSVKTSLPSFPSLWVNEVQPENLSGPGDGKGQREPWLELYNADTNSVSLSGFYLTDTYTNLTKWAFPSGATVAAQSFKLVWLDGETADTTDSEWHAGFRIAPTNGSIALVRLVGSRPVVCDYLNYSWVSAGRSYGAYPDGQPRGRQVFHFPTPLATNNPASQTIKVFVNEWMASNSSIADPADGHYDDWFELYNAGNEPVDLGRYTLTDTLTNTTKFAVPAGTVIGAGGYLLVWADEDTDQNSPTNAQVHANFKLSQGGEAIGLYAPDGSLVDAVTFGAQTSDISQGRWPDGGSEPFFFMPYPTPGEANMVSSTNHPPVLTVASSFSVNENETLTFKASATDVDADQTLTFSLGGGAPAGAVIHPTTGVFEWTPTEAQGPGSYNVTIKVSDNGGPSMSGIGRVTITVHEVNSRPVMTPMANQTVDEGQRLNLVFQAVDADLPAQKLSFIMDAGAPAGATLDANTGVFSFTPSETQGGATYQVTVRVADDGTPSLEDSTSFSITVKETNTRPDIVPLGDQSVFENESLSFSVSALDSDIPAQTLTYGIESGAPSGMVINPATGVVTWTPTANQIPSTNDVVIRVADNGTPAMENTRTVRVVAYRANRTPVLAAIADQVIDEGKIFSLQIVGTDPDTDQTLTYSIESGAPDGMSIQPITGVLSWFPTEEQGPSTNRITVKLKDNGMPERSDVKTFTVTVREVNTAPVMAPVADQSLIPGETLNLKLSATDADLPANTLTWSLGEGAPEGMAIDGQSGVLTWTPSRQQTPSTNTVQVRVTDNGTPALSAVQGMTVIVNTEAPWQFYSVTGTASSSLLYMYLTAPGDVYVDDLQIVPGSVPATGDNTVLNGGFESALTGPWTVSANHSGSAIVTNSAKEGLSSLHLVASTGGTTRDSSVYQTITPALEANATYTLSYWYRAGANPAPLVLRLSGFGISSTNVITAVANNQAPVLSMVNDQEVKWGTWLVFSVSASNAEADQHMAYSLSADAPADAWIDPDTGSFEWAPTYGDVGTHWISIRVTDDGYPIRSDTVTFKVVVTGQVASPHIRQITHAPSKGITLEWDADAGATYQVQGCNNLKDGTWVSVGQAIKAAGTTASAVDYPLTNSMRFYRVVRLINP